MSIGTIIMLLLRYGPMVLGVVREIIAFIERLRGEPACASIECSSYQRRLDNAIDFAEKAPKWLRREARSRLVELRNEVRVRHDQAVVQRAERPAR